MTETLRFRLASMQHTDTVEQSTEDVRKAIPVHSDISPDFLGFTELDPTGFQIVKARCEVTGYTLIRKGSVGIAVHPRHSLVEKGHVDVLPAFRSPSGKGSYRARSILEVTVETPEGTLATVHLGHWITDGSSRREDKRLSQSRAMLDRVRLHGSGDRLSFWMGDTNSDEATPDRVQKALGNLVSIYDALDEYPDTHGRRTIDVIGHYAADLRVNPVSVRVSGRRNSDHRQVDAVYEVTARP